MSIPQKTVDLIMLKQERYPHAECLTCPLLSQPPVDGYVETDNLDDIQAVYVAEHPGAEEARQGIPLVGQAGQCLELAVKAVGGDWERSYRTNAVLCLPPYGTKLDKQAVECCNGRLKRELGEIARRNPEAKIISMGNHAAQASYQIAGKKTGAKITTLRGSNITAGPIGSRIYFTFNPAYILRSKQQSPLFLQDIETALFGRRYPYPELAESPPEIRHCIGVESALEALKSLKLGYLAYDIEATTAITFDQLRTESGRVTAFGITDDISYCYVLSPEVLSDQRVKDQLNSIFSEFGMRGVAHNGKFDQLFLREKMNIWVRVDFDTMLAHYAFDENSFHDLKTLSRDFLGVPDYDAEVDKYVYKKKGLKKVKWYDKVPYDVLTKYLAYDVCCTLALQKVFKKRLKDEGLYEKPFLNPLMRGSDLLGDMEARGLTVDIPYFESQVATVSIEMAELVVEMRRLAHKSDLNPRSWVQVKPILYDKFQFPKVSGKGFKVGSTGKDALKKITEVMRTRTGDPTWSHPFIEAKLKYSRVNKISTSYINPLQTWPHPDDHKVHPTFNLHIAVTGRLSAHDPAVQTMPRPTDKWGRIIRAGFIASEGMVLGKVDYSQAELRTLAVESQDQYLLWCYNNGIDLHSSMAELVRDAATAVNWEQEIVQPRSVAKIVNFGYAYDATPAGLASTFPNLIDYRTARRIHKEYDEKLYGATAWKKMTKEFCYRNGYVETVFGRKRRFPAVAEDNRVEIGRKAVNFPIQSTASDLTLMAAINLNNLGIPIVLLVHDEIVIEAREDEAPDMMNEVAREMLLVAHNYSSDVVWAVDGSLRSRWAGRTVDEEMEYEKKEWSTESW